MPPDFADPDPPDFPIPGRADAAVVGGGVVGLCVAYELLKEGREVVVVDRGPIARGAAAGSAGFIAPSHVIPMAAPGAPRNAVRSILRRTGPVAARPSLDPAYLGWILRFIRSCTPGRVEAGAAALAALCFVSAEMTEKLITEEGIECGYRRDGLLHIYGSKQALAAARLEAAEMEHYGVPVEMLGPAEIREMEPAAGDEVTGGFLCADDAGLDPAVFLSSLASLLAARGVRFAPHTELLGFGFSSDAVERLVTTRGDLAVDRVAVAAGAWTPGVASFLGSRLPIQGGKGYSMTVARPRSGPRRNILIGDRWVAVNPMGGRLRLTGWLELGRLDAVPSFRRLADIEANARSRLRLDPELTVLERWAGVRPVTPDGLPVIGPDPAWRNVVYAAGHGKIGLSLGPVTGRMVAQMMNGRASDIDPAPFSPARFA